jgi:hypothetical protein
LRDSLRTTRTKTHGKFYFGITGLTVVHNSEHRLTVSSEPNVGHRVNRVANMDSEAGLLSEFTLECLISVFTVLDAATGN